ncbi:MAG: HDIG domain-containing protein [Balneolaceae bacterium]|nr:HDIG domain-containing protein [Balneolaceae bacterium]MBO6546829.1 HDIG domain-containing protein [Balneolaceae bacterium]MBO6649189.1 HDIG domain-containing protein [Balneolaceae bacterium]
MGLLEKFGLGRKKKEMVPLLGEKMKKEQEAYSLRRNPYLRAFIFLCFILISVFSLPRTSVRSTFNYTVGQPWRVDDLTAPYTFALKKTAEEIATERETIEEQLSPIFVVDVGAPIAVQTRLDSLYRTLQPVLETYNDWQTAKDDNSTTVLDDSLRFSREYEQSNIGLTDFSLNTLLLSYHQVKSRNLPDNRFSGIIVKQSLENVIDDLLNQGIINVNKANIEADQITILNPSQSTEQPIDIARVRDLRGANEYAQFQLNRMLSEELARLGIELYNKVIAPNFKISEERRQARLDEAIANISETKGAMAQGQVIIRRGDIVNEETANILASLDEARSLNASDMERWLRFGGGVILVIVISMVFFMYLYLYRRKISGHNGLFFLVFLTLSLISIATAVVVTLDVAHPYIIPVAIAPIILTIIFDSRVGIIASVTLASLIGLVHGYNFEFTITTIAACSMGVFSVRDVKDRSQFFFTTPGIVFLTYVITMGAFSLARMDGWEVVLNNLMFIAINSVFILFTYPIILLFEKLFGVTTDFTLLELGDTNQPLLKELMNKAPGTFHHSLQVANLSEAAASAIGANSLLSRVGALYHDIGKMIKPDYFVENQSGGVNEHDKLKPQMSAMVIKAHVSEGVKMAEEHKLPKTLIHFIETHHGTSTIRYFYEKAKNDDNLKEILEEEQFKYDGPLPSTKETGILLLADGIEAASRAMKNPTYSKLETLVHRMVDDRVSEGQLSHCPLTFRDLQVIKETFLNILVGVYHSRIEYPEDQKREQEEAEKEAAANTEKADEQKENSAENQESQEEESQQQ